MAYDVVIVGAGPIGCRVAELTAKRGLKVALIDKKKEVGVPVQCAGLVSHRLREMLPKLPKNVIVNSVKRAKFFSGSADLEIKSKKPFYIIDREKLDKFLFLQAKRAGVDVGIPVMFKDIVKKNEESLIISTNAGKMETKILVGGDGPGSIVATKAGLKRPANMMTGVQMTVNVKDMFDSGAVELFFGRAVTPDFFGWVIPLSSDRARIGIAAKKNSAEYLKQLVEKRTGGNIKRSEIKPDVAGMINSGLMKRTSTDRVIIVGDAAAHVKPFSGGGMIYGLIGAGHCANACIKAVKENDFSAEFFDREYDKKWKYQLAHSIKRGLQYRKILYGFDGEISNRMIKWILRFGKWFKPVLEGFDVDLL